MKPKKQKVERNLEVPSERQFSFLRQIKFQVDKLQPGSILVIVHFILKLLGLFCAAKSFYSNYMHIWWVDLELLTSSPFNYNLCRKYKGFTQETHHWLLGQYLLQKRELRLHRVQTQRCLILCYPVQQQN